MRTLLVVPVLALALSCGARDPRVGSDLLLDMSPSGPVPVVGAYDFELLGEVGGKACVKRDDESLYWVGIPQITRMSSDPRVRRAISAAAYDAISRLDDVDSIVLTRVLVDGGKADRICSDVIGRAVKLTKARAPGEPAPAQANPAPPRTDAPGIPDQR